MHSRVAFFLLFLSLSVWADVLLAQSAPTLAAVQSPRFAISRFELLGSTLLVEGESTAALEKFTGESREFGDIQRAVEALEQLYRSKGYSTVYVAVPEQELEKGIVSLRVVEGKLVRVLVDGHQFFTTENIRASLPQLREGQAPLATRLSENIQLANENPTKQVDVLLAVGEREGEINARIKVRDEKVWRASASVDNTGTKATGTHRLGIALQHNNLFDADHSGSFSYTTSPDKPEGAQVDVYSLGYRLPLYAWGDSLEFLYANSTVGVPSSSPSLGGALAIVGKGQIFSARYNWLLPRLGEYVSRVIFAVDDRDMKSSCLSGGQPLTGVAGCEPYRVTPFSVTYSGKLEQASRVINFALGAASNLHASSSDSYRLASANREAPIHFSVWRANAALAQGFDSDWQLRLMAQAQWSNTPLLPTEQMSLAGSQAVRGFQERAVAADRGYVVQAELYTPELAALVGAPGNLRGLAFLDLAAGNSLGMPLGQIGRAAIASAGLGLRYAVDKTFSLRFDVAQILDSHSTIANGAPLDTGWRGHFSLSVGY